MSLVKKIYNKKYIRKHLSKVLFSLKNRPSLDPKIKGNKKDKAIFVVSADFELGWAFRYSKSSSNPEKRAKQTRENFTFLLKMFEQYKISITWAIIGHLFLRECKKGDHDWMHRIPYFENRNWSYNKGDWFDCDPYTSSEKGKGWYAPDLIENILNSKVKHEVGCHSFSHIDLTYKNCPPEVAEDEIRACVEAAKDWGITLKSFVFPGGTYGNFEVLKKYGFTSFRKTLKYELTNPFIEGNGLVVIPVSNGLGDNGLGWSKEYYIKRLKKYIDRAIKTGTVCHFWFHPSIDEWFLHNVFPEILSYAAEMREQGKLWITTMEEIAEYINKEKAQ